MREKERQRDNAMSEKERQCNERERQKDEEKNVTDTGRREGTLKKE